jgi:hypothetical protein
MQAKGDKRQPGWKGGVLAPVVLLCLNLFILGTASVYFGNQGEFLVEDEDVLAVLLVPAVAAMLVLGAVGYLLGRRWLLPTAAVLYFLAFVTYLHGNLLRWDTGVLDGAALDMDRLGPIAVDALAWLVLGALAWRFRAWLAVHGWKLCVLLGLFQLIGALDLKHNAKTGNRVMQDVPAELYAFHAGPNVLHIILDGFQGDIFERVVADHPEFAESWRGFVHFRDTLTPSAVTYLSVPATLSGKAFDNRTTIPAYHDETLGGENLYALLARNGFAVDVASPVWWNLARDYFASYFAVPTPFAGLDETIRSTAWYLLDISLFRQLPYLLKPLVYRDGAWLVSSELAAHPEQQFQHFAHGRFLDDLAAKAHAGRDAPTYKLLHVISPHAPLVSRPDCSYAGGELEIAAEAFADQSLCAMRTVDRLFERLKALGLYDDMMILVHGDHGGGVGFAMTAADGSATDSSVALEGVWGNPLPLLLVKPPRAEGPLRASQRPVALTDVAATVATVLGFEHRFPGQSVFSGLRPAPRRMFYHSTQHRNDAAERGRFTDFTTYAVEGSVFDAAAWSRVDHFQASAEDLSGQYVWGTPLTFGRSGTFKPFGDGGWTVTRGSDINWTQGRESGLRLPVDPPGGAVRLQFTVRPLLAPGKLARQRVGVRVNGQDLAELELVEDRFRTYTVDIPAALAQDGVLAVRFLLPDAMSPMELGTGEDERLLALAFMNVRLDPLE